MAAPKLKAVEQTEAFPAAHVKFIGLSASAIDSPCDLGDTQTYTVVAECVGTGQELQKDGAVREIRKMEVKEVTFGEIQKAPTDPQLSLTDDLEDEDDA